jgi:hypothetical protein
MNKKIVGFLIGISLIVIAVPLVESSKNILREPIVPNTSEKSLVGTWTEMQKILASDGAPTDLFGCSISIDNDTALIGAYRDDSGKGSVYVFTRNGTLWKQQAKLLASDGSTQDFFGVSVSLSGDTALIGAPEYETNEPGSAYVFTRTGTTWTQQAKLLASDGAPDNVFGLSVSLFGYTALIGAPGDDDHGSAYIFIRSGITWTQQQKLLASDGEAFDAFGVSVSLSGDTAVIGSIQDDDNGNDSGSAYVFTLTNTTWTQQAKLRASDGAAEDWFGHSISLDGNTVLIGADGDDDFRGSAYVFTRIGTTWTQETKLLASDGSDWSWFSSSVSLDGDTALIGADFDFNNGGETGSAYMFTRIGTTWTQETKLLASDGAYHDYFGTSVALEGDTILIGASYDSDNGVESGSVYGFSKIDLTFSIAGGLGLSIKITNNGINNVTGVPYWIHVKGGILGLINKTMNGTIDISAGETISVAALKLFGLGHIKITVKVANIEKIIDGTQIFIFSIIK